MMDAHPVGCKTHSNAECCNSHSNVQGLRVTEPVSCSPDIDLEDNGVAELAHDDNKARRRVVELAVLPDQQERVQRGTEDGNEL